MKDAVDRTPLLQRIEHATALELFRLKGRVALVNGAGGRLGSAVATAFAEAGAHVLLNGRSVAPLQRLQTTLQARGLSSGVVAFDVTDQRAAQYVMRRIRDEHGRLDILVNNAYSGRSGGPESVSPGDFAASYEIAVVAAFRLIKEAHELMLAAGRAAGHASVINIASIYGVVSPDPKIYGTSGVDNPPYYGAEKVALIQLTRYAACHLAPLGIRVNALVPGPFPPPDVLERHPDFGHALERRTPLGRTVHPAELKGAALFLGSDASSYVTGATLAVDGGWTAW